MPNFYIHSLTIEKIFRMCKFIQFLRKKILLSPMDRVQLSLNVHFIYSVSFNIYNWILTFSSFSAISLFGTSVKRRFLDIKNLFGVFFFNHMIYVKLKTFMLAMIEGLQNVRILNNRFSVRKSDRTRGSIGEHTCSTLKQLIVKVFDDIYA